MTTRRTLLQAALLAGLPTTVAALSARAQSAAQSTAMSLTPTPACGEGHGAATPPQTEGPYFRPNSPARRSLLDPELPGTRLRVGGLVLSRACRPLPAVLVDLWHADAQGDYDNAGYRLRGHQFTDADGRWQFETIVPAVYPGRTCHLHVKLQPRHGRVLTTQLYFPGEAGNARDPIFDKRLLLAMAGDATAQIARYDFVLDIA